MHPGIHAARRPSAVAVVSTSSGEEMTYAQLDAASNRLAHLLRHEGLTTGDHVAVMLENTPRYLEVTWAVLRSGLYLTPINTHLGAEEAAYIIRDCDATVLITSERFADTVDAARGALGEVRVKLAIGGGIGGGIGGFDDLDAATRPMPSTPIADESEGSWMFYSSGTTGHPKGILPPLSNAPLGTGTKIDALLEHLYGFTSETVYLCPAPLYHAAPSGWSVSTQRLGGTVVIMDRFDPESALAAIERYKVTHAQFVPTHFVRLLKLPAEVRESYDLSSLTMVVHAAAPCPVDVKRQMFSWLGPIIHEYYSASEGSGFCAISPDEWLAHPGSVGRSMGGAIHVIGEDGREVPMGEDGQIWFETESRFEYHKDPAKTAGVFNEHGWSTLGDVGHLDDEGYLYLTDRVSHMIISGGVNIYPREIEDVLIGHPAVADVAVIGIPDEEMGESVLAVVELGDPTQANRELAAELLALSRSRLAGFKCPRRIDFADELPRLPTGKLLKRVLLERYRERAD
jgi:acyl-CoA synthetase (AMP-forming)/AMP-acid ligase II